VVAGWKSVNDSSKPGDIVPLHMDGVVLTVNDERDLTLSFQF